MPTGFFLHLALELLKVGEHCTLLLHREDPRVERVVVDEGDVVAASADRRHLSRSPCRIRVYNGRFHIVPLDGLSLGHFCK